MKTQRWKQFSGAFCFIPIVLKMFERAIAFATLYQPISMFNILLSAAKRYKKLVLIFIQCLVISC